MKRAVQLMLLCLAVLGAAAGQAQAAVMFFTANPTTNSTDWATAVTNLGGTINTNVDFNTHPLGALQNNFYQGSEGVTFSTSGAIGAVTSGAGPGQSTTGNPNLGEGVHASSNHLRAGSGVSDLTISFAGPVLGAGLFAIDMFSSNSLRFSAFDGPDGTGTLLGSALGVNLNLQQNGLYFVGVSSTANDIRSIRVSHPGALIDVIGWDDLRFASSANIPEPTSLALLGMTAAGFCGVRLRRRRKGDPADTTQAA